MLIYGLIVARGLRASLVAKEPFAKLLAAGLAFVFAIQVFAILGGVTRLLPLTGLTTPFMSQGGSSLIANWVTIGLLLIITHQVRSPAAAQTSDSQEWLAAETTQLIPVAVGAPFAAQPRPAPAAPAPNAHADADADEPTQINPIQGGRP